MIVGRGLQMEHERVFTQIPPVPQDISQDLLDHYREILGIEERSLRNLFQELLSFKRAVFSFEICGPVETLYEIDRYLKDNDYLTYCQIEHVEEGDENCEYLPEDLFSRYPGKTLGAALICISLREEFIHLIKMAEEYPLACNDHEICDPRAALRGLLYGYALKNIIGFIEEDEPAGN